MPEPVTYVDVLAMFLNQTATSGWSIAQADFLVTKEGAETRSQVALGKQLKKTVPIGGGVGGSAQAVAQNVFQMLDISRGPYPKVYTALFEFSGGTWKMKVFKLLARVEPVSTAIRPTVREWPGQPDDEATLIIEDVQGTRQLVLTTASLLIKEQDPRRWDNLLITIAPFALPLLPKIGRLAGLKGLQILEDRVIFRGLINNRALENLTQQEIRNAFAKVGLREAHNGHFISMLIERGPEFGINSLDDLARAMNRGTVRSGTTAGTVDIMLPNSTKVVANMDGELITFVPVK